MVLKLAVSYHVYRAQRSVDSKMPSRAITSLLNPKKLLIAASLLAFLMPGFLSFHSIPAYAVEVTQGFAPERYKNGTHFGTGIYFAPHQFTLYTEPKTNSPTLGTIEWSSKSGLNGLRMTSPGGMPKSIYADKLFFCYYPELDIAMMAVDGDNDNGWVEVIYDQQEHKTAWVKANTDENSTGSDASTTLTSNTASSHLGVYQTWLEFMKYNAKAKGIYWLNGVAEYNRALRTKDEDTAKLISTTVIRKLKVRYVRGNWLLVEVQDFEMNTPIGWIRWRDDDGNLMAFPNLTQPQASNQITPSY
jgi:hypothetical protein